MSLRGCVKWFNPKLGYGYITSDSIDYFVHYNSLVVENNEIKKSLITGEYVQFNAGIPDDKYEYKAIDVTGINRGKLMCESRNFKLKNKNENKSKPKYSYSYIRLNKNKIKRIEDSYEWNH
tara:strand:+ start:441 stop:803 length:363 start_codon:yes stop_codon:yes gene_type:complete